MIATKTKYPKNVTRRGNSTAAEEQLLVGDVPSPPGTGIYGPAEIEFWTGAAPFRHASGIWGRTALLDYLARQIESGDTVVDLGCGGGYVTTKLCKFVGARGRVLGLDSSAPLIAEATHLEKRVSKLSFSLADVTGKLPLSNESVDLFVSFMLLQNLQNAEIERMSEEIDRCLFSPISFCQIP